LARHSSQPPWEFLLSASRNSLQSFEFTRLSHAANLRKEIAALLDQWQEETASAMLARWLMDQRERHGKTAEPAFSPEAAALDSEVSHPNGSPPNRSRSNGYSASDNVFADLPEPLPQKRRSA
jgi:hypothetical protein